MDVKKLRKSAKAVGQLVPVLKDKHGNIIDGYHRKRADINWKEVKLESVDTEGKLLAVQLSSNWLRRNMKPEEKTRILTRLCEIFKDELKGISDKFQEAAKELGIGFDELVDEVFDLIISLLLFQYIR